MAKAANTGTHVKPVQEQQPKKKLTYAERLELERLEQELSRSEAELKMLAMEMNSCGSNYGKLAELTARQQEVQSKLEEMEERWLYLSEFEG